MSTDQIWEMMKANSYAINKSLTSYIIKNRFKLNVHSRTILNPNFVELECYDIAEIRDITTVSALTVTFTAIVSINVKIKGHIISSYTEDKSFTWLKLECSAKSDLSFFEIDKIMEIDNKTNATYSLPNITKDNIDYFAEKFLVNNCPEALTSPVALPIKDMADKMYVGIEKTLSESEKYCLNGETGLGKHFCALKYDYSRRKFAYRNAFWRHETDEKIIIFSKNEKYNIFDTVDHAILNMLIHCEFHYKFFELIGSDIYDVPTEMPIIKSNLVAENVNPVDLMEQQSIALLPRIMIPTQTGCSKFEEILNKLKIKFPELRSAEIMEKAIEEFAKFYEVSILLAKQRAIDMGFDQAAGTFITVNGHKYPPVSFGFGELKKGTSLLVGGDECIGIIKRNNIFATLYENGKIINVNGLWVINNPKYVTPIDYSVFELTDYALEHIAECAVVVKHIRSNLFNNNCLYYATGDEYSFNEDYLTEELVVQLDNADKEFQELQDRINEIAGFPQSFYQTLMKLRKNRNIEISDLACYSTLSEPTIYKYFNTNTSDEDKPKCDFYSILKLCVGLKLEYEYAIDLLRKANYSIDYDTDENRAYRYLIKYCYDKGIAFWDGFLDRKNIPILSLRNPTRNKNKEME